MLANSEFLVMLNQASTDRMELAKLLSISENHVTYFLRIKIGRLWMSHKNRKAVSDHKRI